MNISEIIQKIAEELGFDLVGVAEIASSDYLLAMTEAGEKLDKWIADGYHADMKWMANLESLEKRKDILKVMPSAKSVICVAMNYYQKTAIKDIQEYHFNRYSGKNDKSVLSEKSAGVIARYAVGRDYHKIFDKKLKLFAKKLEEVFCHPPVPVRTGSRPPKGRINSSGNPEKITKDWIPASAGMTKEKMGMTNAKFKCYSDTGPVLERAWAVKAGLGFVGKNTNLITKYGSWVLLGEIITNVKIPNSKFQIQNSGQCGSCRRCLDVCPTGALVAPYIVDARKCISYLTIEYKDEIPMELREKMGNRIFGCDACQEICPFNIGRQMEGINFKKAQNSLINYYHFYRYSGKSDNNREENIANKDKGNKDMGIIAGPIRDLKEILSIKTDEEFLEKFRPPTGGSPVMRAKRRGLVRNACIAAGNSGDKSLLLYLKDCVKDDDEIISEAAKWAIEKIENRS